MKLNVQIIIFYGNFYLGSVEETFCSLFYMLNIRFVFKTYIDKKFRKNTFFIIEILEKNF
jgi:hypothetical protein